MVVDPLKKNLAWSEFERVGLHVGTILEGAPLEDARRPAYILKVDFGPLGILKTSAQITVHYSIDELIGRQVIGVLHFPDKQIGKHVSQFLLLGAHDEQGGVVILSLDQTVPNGSKVS